MPADRSQPRHLPPRVIAWEDRTAWPLFVLSLAFFAAAVWLVADRELGGAGRGALIAFLVVCWGVFAADIVARMVLARDVRAVLRRRWFEIAAVVIPLLRPFTILTYITRMPWFGASPRRRHAQLVIFAALFTVTFVITASSLVWLAERDDPNASIRSLGDAIWWGFATIATVGYGDYTPVTVVGRVLAVALMMGGIVVIGIASGTVISIVTDQVKVAHQHRAEERAEAAEDAPHAGHAERTGARGR